MPIEKRSMRIGDIEIDLLETGAGRPLLFLHGGEGPDVVSADYLGKLGAHFRVIAPWHPGFGAHPRPPAFRDVADLAYFYLEFAETLALRDTVLAGASFGGWIAAEMALRGSAHFSRLALVDPFGVKAGDRESRDIADFWSMTPADWNDLAFVNATIVRDDPAMLTDDQLIGLLRSRESMAYYGWRPFMHNPQLLRWLHLIRIPTLIVRGEQDRVVAADCHRLYADRIPGAQLQIIPGAGHFPHLEQPDAFVAAVTGFANRSDPARAAAA